MKKKAPAKVKRPTDVNQLAHFLGEQSTKQVESKNGDAPTDAEVYRVMSALGRKGGKIGGANRAKALTPKRRREIALKAARARWDNQASS
jgi:hypothetical protein